MTYEPRPTPAAGPASARDEAERLREVAALGILDTGPEPHFEAVCRTARRLFGVEAAFVTLVDDRHLWLKTSCSLVPPVMPRSEGFCSYVVEHDTTVIARDIREDHRFRRLAGRQGEGGIRFYASTPLALRPGLPVGTLCLAHTAPRDFSTDERAALADLAEIVLAHLRLARTSGERARALAAAEAHEALIRQQNREIEARALAQERADAQLTMAEQITTSGNWQVALPDGKVTWSAGVYRIAGLDPEAPPPPVRHLLDHYHPDDRERVRATVSEAITSGNPYAYEARFVRPDATVRHVVVGGTCRTDQTGTVTGLVGVLIDVTEQRWAEDAARRSDVRYRGLAENLPLLVWTMRVSDGEATYVNAQFRSYYGPLETARAERLSRNHPDDAPAMEAAWRRALATGRGYSGQWRIRRHDGVYRWHKLSITPIVLDADGSILEWLGTALDVDEIVSAGIAVEDARALLKLAMEAAEAGIWDWDMRTGITTLGPESARMHGLDTASGQPHRLTAAEWTALLNQEDAADAWNEVRRAIDSRTTYAAQFRVGERWIHARGRTVFGEDGRPYRMVGLHLDITDSKAIEAALRAATHDAEVARAEAERASAAKSDFLAAMSHEIRTPLNSILGYADLLLEGNAIAGEDRRRLGMIQNSGAALLTVVNDVLDFSKIEAGELTLESLDFPLLSVIDATLAIVRGGALKSGLQIAAELDPDLPPFVVGDPSRLRQVLLNLLNNAVKFTPAGSVTLRVAREGEGIAPDGRAGDILRFTVIDTGIGIAPAHRERLFRRFSQVDGSISRRFGGTGLGLAISHQLVGMMGGEIDVDSREGEGSSFWFTLVLPRAATPATACAKAGVAEGAHVAPPVEAAVPAQAPEVEEAAGDAAPARIRLLLAEDVPINRELACAVLEAEGHEVDVATNGAEAITAVEAAFAAGRGYDLVLMDVQMPGVDGLAATRRIRTLSPPACDIPIVAMTANIMPEQVDELREAGMDDYVGKPFRRPDLFATIARWTEPGARAQSRAPVDAAPAAAAIEPETLDAAVLDAMRSSFGTDRVDGLLDLLAGELSQRFSPTETDRLQIAYDAHAMVSAAGMLGFSGLSGLCREVEAAAHAGDDLSALIRRLEVQRARALRAIRRLRAA